MFKHIFNKLLIQTKPSQPFQLSILSLIAWVESFLHE